MVAKSAHASAWDGHQHVGRARRRRLRALVEGESEAIGLTHEAAYELEAAVHQRRDSGWPRHVGVGSVAENRGRPREDDELEGLEGNLRQVQGGVEQAPAVQERGRRLGALLILLLALCSAAGGKVEGAAGSQLEPFEERRVQRAQIALLVQLHASIVALVFFTFDAAFRWFRLYRGWRSREKEANVEAKLQLLCA